VERRRGEERRAGEEDEEEEEATDINSNNPHLAGGEKMKILFLMKRNQF
jgi:hypothetical protein